MRARGHGYTYPVRFTVSLFVIALGAILAFGVTATPSGINIQVIGTILILIGLAGLAISHWLFVTRRQTDVVHRPDGSQTWLEPNSPAPNEPWDSMD